MKNKKDILLHVYGDQEAEGELRILLRDDELRREHEALSEARFKMDRLRRSKPDIATIEAIMAEARTASGATVRGAGVDRPPVWRSRSLRRVLIPALSIAAAVVIAVGYGFVTTDTFSSSELNKTIARADDIISPPESLLRATPVPPGFPQIDIVSDGDPELAWDDAGTVRQLYRQIESVGPDNELDWDDRSIALDMIPGSVASNQNLKRASAPRR
jgi:hypothetical protein